MRKSIISPLNCDGEEICVHVASFSPYKMAGINEGLKYLGYVIKPNSYGMVDRFWLLKMVEKRMNVWCYMWIYFGGILKLSRVVLQSIPIYCFSLVIVLASMVSHIKRIISQFLVR